MSRIVGTGMFLRVQLSEHVKASSRRGSTYTSASTLEKGVRLHERQQGIACFFDHLFPVCYHHEIICILSALLWFSILHIVRRQIRVARSGGKQICSAKTPLQASHNSFANALLFCEDGTSVSGARGLHHAKKHFRHVRFGIHKDLR